MMNSNSIMVKCRRCGKNASSSDFILDPVYGLMVCPNCVKERKSKDIQKTKPAHIPKDERIPIMKARPLGWDAEDEYLEQHFRQKQNNIALSKVSTQTYGDKVNYKCFKCKYVFVYNKAKQYPNLCPNCGSRIMV